LPGALFWEIGWAIAMMVNHGADRTYWEVAQHWAIANVTGLALLVIVI